MVPASRTVDRTARSWPVPGRVQDAGCLDGLCTGLIEREHYRSGATAERGYQRAGSRLLAPRQSLASLEPCLLSPSLAGFTVPGPAQAILADLSSCGW